MDVYKSYYDKESTYYIQIPNKKAVITTTIKIEQKASDILNITLDSVLYYNLYPNVVGYYHAPDKNDIDFVEKSTKNEIENLFKNQTYKQIENERF